jgi:SAM-dependent methyltransferase
MRGIEQQPFLYDASMALLERTGLGRWREWLAGGASAGRVLDLGCGTGRNLPLFPPGVRAVGLDPCRQTLARARRRAPGVPLVCARAEALPFREGTFDTVVSGLVFCSVGDPGRGLAEVRRVLRGGGRLRMLEHVRAGGRMAAWLQDRTQPAWTWLTGGCHPNRDTEASVVAAGFAIDPSTRRAQGDMRRFEASAPAVRGSTHNESVCSGANP